MVATAVAVGRAAAELAEMRARLAHVRLEERRVIRREIHDGLGPSLAGIRLGLQGARNLLQTDPAAGQALLATSRTRSRRPPTASAASRTTCSRRCSTSSGSRRR